MMAQTNTTEIVQKIALKVGEIYSAAASAGFLAIVLSAFYFDVTVTFFFCSTAFVSSATLLLFFPDDIKKPIKKF